MRFVAGLHEEATSVSMAEVFVCTTRTSAMNAPKGVCSEDNRGISRSIYISNEYVERRRRDQRVGAAQLLSPLCMEYADGERVELAQLHPYKEESDVISLHYQVHEREQL